MISKIIQKVVGFFEKDGAAADHHKDQRIAEDRDKFVREFCIALMVSEHMIEAYGAPDGPNTYNVAIRAWAEYSDAKDEDGGYDE